MTLTASSSATRRRTTTRSKRYPTFVAKSGRVEEGQVTPNAPADLAERRKKLLTLNRTWLEFDRKLRSARLRFDELLANDETMVRKRLT